MISRRSFLQTAAALGAAATPLRHAHAQTSFPARPVTLYCAFPAGGPTDQVFRALAESSSKLLGQNIVVENKPGAGGILPAQLLLSARNDGYVLAQMPMGVFRIPHMQNRPAFNPAQDFTYIINLTGYTFGLVVPASSSIQTLKDFIEFARANPDKMNYGSTGVGTSPHLALEELSQIAGIRLNHVPYKGSADLMVAVLGGQVMAASDSTGWAPHVESGKLRLLATYGSQRTKRWPRVPTLKELGYPIVSDSPFGLAGPKGMDPAVMRTLHDAFRKALEDPKVLGVLEKYDQPVIYQGPEEYTQFARTTFEAEKATIERIGLKGTM